MSSQLDDQVRSALDRVRVAVTGQLEAELTASASDILRVAGELQRQAVAEAAEGAVSDTTAEAQRQIESLREAFERQVTALEQRLASETAALEQRLVSDTEALERRRASETAALEGELRAARDELSASRQALDVTGREREQLSRQLEQARREEEQSRRALESAHVEIAAARHEVEQLRLAIEGRTKALEDAQRHGDELARGVEGLRTRLANVERIAFALRALNEAASLSEVLDGLARAARREPGRSAVFLVQDGRLRGWRGVGLDAVQAAPDADPASAASALLDRALRSRATQFSAEDGVLPAFARGNGMRDAVAAPIEVGGSVIAVLYADAPKADTPEEREWQRTIEPMAKHAGRMLEAMTLRQAAALWTPRTGPASTSIGHRAAGSVGLS